jgi:hypothetical protein
MHTGRSNSSNISTTNDTKTSRKQSKAGRVIIKVTEEIMRKRSAEITNISEFILNDLFSEILNGRALVEDLTDTVFSAPSGNGLRMISKK